jgi:hypothetical protein
LDEERQEALSRNNLEALQKVVVFVDTIGCLVAEQLIEFNKTGKYANAMTALLLQSKIGPQQPLHKEQKQDTVFNKLFEMVELPTFP